MTNKSYFKYWGKTEKIGEEKPLRYHLLPYHCLDVAAVAAVWWDASPAIRRAFRIHNNLFVEQLRAWLLFFISLHDYGKFDARFQLKAPHAWKRLYPQAGHYSSLPAIQDCKNYIHGEKGLAWFMDDHDEMFGCNSDNAETGLNFLDEIEEPYSEHWSSWKPWLEAVTGHHGHIKDADYVSSDALPPMCDQRLAEVDRLARREWLDALANLFLHPVSLSLNDLPPDCSPLMAGFCSVADWLGSRCDGKNFIFYPEPADLKSYFEQRCAEDAINTLRIAGMVGKVHSYTGVKALLKPDFFPRSMQTLVDNLPLQAGMTIVEAPTGSGKTEAALAYAWRLIEAGLADSIIFALPTQATANAMLGRVERLATTLFDDHPNILLAHGSVRFNKTFTVLKHAALKEYENGDGWTQCCQWLAESRKRIFLGQIGVCTIDQVLISVLPVKHRFVRSFGVGRSVLIVDEVHAYDAYMYGLLEEVLRQQEKSGGSVILLSATLPERLRQHLFRAWGAELEPTGDSAPYPLASWTDGEITKYFELDRTQRPTQNSVSIEPVMVKQMEPDDLLLTRVVAAAECGAQVAIVCNLVDTAQTVAQKLRALTGFPVDLFHARYCYIHRQEKELAALEHFGPDGTRSTGRIMVATQVVEQSLDLDFDWLITQLCPVDLLFQRIGRLHRHARPQRPFGFGHPLCTVLLPEGEDYGLHGLIYGDTRILWRTAQKISAAPEKKIIFPNAYRTWIEPVYKMEAWEDEPPEIQEEHEKFLYEVEMVKRFKAQYMIDSVMNPFADTDEKITAVTRDGEMNLTVIPYCQKTAGKMLMDGTILESLDEYQRLEVLALNSLGVPKSWRYSFETPDEEGRFWLAMEYNGESYEGCSKGATFHYHKDTGLERKK